MKKLWNAIVKFFAALMGGNTAKENIHATCFMVNNVSVRSSMRLMDPLNNDINKRDIIQWLVGQGYTKIYVGAAMPPKTGKTRYIYEHSQMATWRLWLSQSKESGLDVILWFHGGNFKDVNHWSEGSFTGFMKQIDIDLGDLISEYCIGIEVNEYGWGASRIGRACEFIRGVSGKPVGVHTGQHTQIEYAEKADVFYVQYGFGKSGAFIQNATQWVREHLPRKRIIACEYHMSGETDEARKLGDDAAVFADGIGNGCTAKGLKILENKAK